MAAVRLIKRRKYVCSERQGVAMRKESACVYEPAVKKHCNECLNSTLVEINSIAKSAKHLFEGTCRQCGMLYADITEDTREKHLDADIKRAINVIERRSTAKIKAARLFEQNLEAAAYDLYVQENGEKAPVKNLGRLSKKKQDAIKAKATRVMKKDLGFLYSTVLGGKDVDDRPAPNFSATPFCVSPTTIVTDFHEICSTYCSWDNILRSLKEEKDAHVTYQMNPHLVTRNCGVDQYSCYVCWCLLDFDFTAENEPVGIDCKVCSCSDQSETLPPEVSWSLKEDSSKPTQTQFVIMMKSPPTLFLYLYNSMFKGYVIHTNCCDHLAKR